MKPLYDCEVRFARIAAAFLLICASLHPRAGEVRVTFINTATSQRDTLKVLEESGISKEALILFSRALHDYYAEPFAIDLALFPRTDNGEFHFSSIEELLNAIRNPLSETEHPWTINCFDTLFLLLTDSLELKLTPASLDGPFFAIVTGSEKLSILPTATPEDAFSLTYPEWYRERAAKYFPTPQQMDRRVALTAAIYTSSPLPITTDTNNLNKTTLEILRARWRRHGLKPTRHTIVLGHEVNLPGRYFVTGHAGLLLPNKKNWTYIEKAGGRGPFIRLDLTDLADLQKWYGALYPGPRNGYTHFLMSLNDREIFRVDGSTNLSSNTSSPPKIR